MAKDVPFTLEDHIFYGLQLDEKQKVFRDAIWDPNKLIVMCNSKAGTGKSTIAMATANLLVEHGLYDGIIYLVSPTQEQKQGFLPGDQEAKTAPYIQPLRDALLSININPDRVIISDNNDSAAAKRGDAYIHFMADTYLRGCNLENKVVIIDESQNFYFDQLKRALTRIHDNCKTIVIGHTEQCDLYKNPNRSGFSIYLNAFAEIAKTDARIAICELTKNYRGWVSTISDNVQPTY
jgi:phosphate starvation-inducible protein PhoH